MRRRILLSIAVPVGVLLLTCGCATKKYVAKQIAPVNQRVETLETTTNQRFTTTDEKIAAVAATETKDVSQLNERISTTETKLGQTTSAIAAAQSAAADAKASAAEAKAAADASASKSSQAVSNLAAGVAASLNYQLVEKADVTFGFAKATLTPEAKAALDQVAAKTQGLPRYLVEVVGFTDTTGSADYNVELSQRRADAVQRYLIAQKVPVRVIRTVGMGEETPPPDLAADLSAIDPNPSKADLNRLARRVRVRIFGASDVPQAQASGGGNDRQQ
jgi:outer membrane protein OmpA-like peptidoglycan-associated protein